MTRGVVSTTHVVRNGIDTWAGIVFCAGVYGDGQCRNMGPKGNHELQ